eukprot:sb/3468851/
MVTRELHFHGYVTSSLLGDNQYPSDALTLLYYLGEGWYRSSYWGTCFSNDRQEDTSYYRYSKKVGVGYNGGYIYFDSGHYRCRIKNTVYVSNANMLTVTGKMLFTFESDAYVMGEIEWYLKGDAVQQDSERVLFNTWRTQLILQPATASDLGQYMVVVKFDSLTRSTFIQLKYYGKWWHSIFGHMTSSHAHIWSDSGDQVADKADWVEFGNGGWDGWDVGLNRAKRKERYFYSLFSSPLQLLRVTV